MAGPAKCGPASESCRQADEEGGSGGGPAGARARGRERSGPPTVTCPPPRQLPRRWLVRATGDIPQNHVTQVWTAVAEIVWTAAAGIDTPRQFSYACSVSDHQAKLQSLAKHWNQAQVRERIDLPNYMGGLCSALGVESPGPGGSGYEYEYRILSSGRGTRALRIDLFKTHSFMLEAKGQITSERKLQAAYEQLKGYARFLGNSTPPYALALAVAQQVTIWEAERGRLSQFSARRTISLRTLHDSPANIDLLLSILGTQRHSPHPLAQAVEPPRSLRTVGDLSDDELETLALEMDLEHQRALRGPTLGFVGFEKNTLLWEIDSELARRGLPPRPSQRSLLTKLHVWWKRK